MYRGNLFKNGWGGEKRRHPKAVMALAVGLLALTLCLVACAPNATTNSASSLPSTGDATSESSDGDSASDGDLSFTTAADFTELSTGLFPDTNRNAEFQNTGNRGCAACHDDLFTLNKNNGNYVHITNQVGLKKGTYNGDCVVCHFTKGGTAGNIMSENIHVRHYGSKQFVEANGNCWSCHVTDTDENGNIVIKLFEDVVYDYGYGGYPRYDDVDETWLKEHGFEEGTFPGTVMIHEPSIDVQLNQDPTEEEQEFNILNYEREDGNDAYSALEQEVESGSYALEVTGVGKPGKYTIDDLKAMPQTEIIATSDCQVVGYNSAMVDTRPMKGVLLKDFIEAVGGIDSSFNTITPKAADGWTAMCPGGSTSLQAYLNNNAILILEQYGHDLNIAQGGPVRMFIPGTGGAFNMKNLVAIDFSKTDDPVAYDTFCTDMIASGKSVNMITTWFDNDGVQGKAGQPMTLEGASYGWNLGSIQHTIDKIMFSFDYGKNWVEVDSPDDFDPYRWSRFALTWTPEKAGTYVLKAKAVDINGEEQGKESSLIVQVTE